MDTHSVVKATINGADKGAVSIIIALGAMLGKILANAGVAEAIADAILRRTSDRVLPWAMALVSFIVGIPMFFEVGLVVVLPLVSASRASLRTTRTSRGRPMSNRRPSNRRARITEWCRHIPAL